MENMQIYNQVRVVPQEAQKTIGGGRLKGMTDINPMWRLKVLTETFGPCGIGWKYTITKQWTEVGANEEVAAFCNIELFIKHEGQWSEAIPGTGGSSFISNERNGKFTSDECFKMALTDALSVACKALGIGADVYWAADKTKYSKPAEAPKTTQPSAVSDKKELKPESIKQLHAIRNQLNASEDDFKRGIEQMLQKTRPGFKVTSLHDLAQISEAEYKGLVKTLNERAQQKQLGAK